MPKSINVSEDFNNFTQQLNFDKNLGEYQSQLLDCLALQNYIVLRNQFYYLNDFPNARNIFVHSNLEVITGYPSSDFTDFGRMYELMHPEDKDFVYEFSLRTIALGKEYKEELKADPYYALFSIDFRLRHKQGHYIWLNRQTTCFKTDKEGNMVYAFVLFTDITHVKKTDSHCIHWLGDYKYKLYFEDLIKKYNKNHNITKREKDILMMILNGESATDIAKKLSISAHTVISHRKNLLRKFCAKNTAELVKFAIEKDLI